MIALAAVGYAWTRLNRDGTDAQMGGLAAVAFWFGFGLVVAFGTFTSLFVVLLPLAVVMLLLSKRFEPTKVWLALAVLVIVPMAWMVTGAIDAGTAGWMAAFLGLGVAGAVAIAFENRWRSRHT
jgi:hypothetical protein